MEKKEPYQEAVFISNDIVLLLLCSERIVWFSFSFSFNYNYQMASVHESSVCFTEYWWKKNVLQMAFFIVFCYRFSYVSIKTTDAGRRIIDVLPFCCRPHSIQINHVLELLDSEKRAILFFMVFNVPTNK